jgi:hypothetical protein
MADMHRVKGATQNADASGVATSGVATPGHCYTVCPRS